MGKGGIVNPETQIFYQPSWNHPPTTVVRIPEKFKEDILRYARQLDALEGETPYEGGLIELLQELRDRFLVTTPIKRRAEAAKLLDNFIKFVDKP